MPPVGHLPVRKEDEWTNDNLSDLTNQTGVKRGIQADQGLGLWYHLPEDRAVDSGTVSAII